MCEELVVACTLQPITLKSQVEWHMTEVSSRVQKLNIAALPMTPLSKDAGQARLAGSWPGWLGGGGAGSEPQ